MMTKKLLVTLIAAAMTPTFATITLAQTLPAIDVVAQEAKNSKDGMTKADGERLSGSKSDLVDILSQSPSVSINKAGALSGFPVIRGVSDARLDTQVDGMPLLSSCPNHMNTPFSYVSPSQMTSVDVYPSITPVSVGGDSIGGSLLVKTKDPVFAEDGKQRTEGEIGAAYRSNANAKEGHVAITTASDRLNVTYKGNYAVAENQHAARDFKTVTTATKAASGTEFSPNVNAATAKDEIAGTAYESMNHNLSFAYQGDDRLFSLGVVNQTTPYQQYPNQRMDMTQNDSTKVNLGYHQSLDWGALDIKAYTEQVNHEMAFMDYKTSTQMPMSTDSKTNGMKISSLVALDQASDLDVGVEIQQFRLDDYWRPNPDAAGMSPGTFQNVNGGVRDRSSVYAEWLSQINPQWHTRLGGRYEQVNTDAGTVNGYHDADSFMMGAKITNEASEAAAFNASDRAKTDNNVNITWLTNYQPSDSFDMDFGLARQVRSPDLYERYTWSTWSMAALMNNFAGDGNGYVGDVNLKAETAYTASANFDWHHVDKQQWGLQLMPYISQVDNYIDAKLVKNYGDFSVLQYANQSARLFGLDLAGHYQLTQDMLGMWTVKMTANYTQGKNTETNDALYNVMPLNGKIAFEQRYQAWQNAIELVMVDKKSDTSDVRNELSTKGYNLVHLRASYLWKTAQLNFGIENVFNTDYQLPTGGAYTGEGDTMSVTGIPLMAMPGQGRNVYVGVNYSF